MRTCTFILVFALLNCLSGQSQLIYTGHIRDAGRRTDLSGVKIEWKNTDLVTLSNSFGDFSLKINDQPETESHQPFRFFGNNIIWEENPSLTLKIINLNGISLIHENFIGNSGIYLLPRLKFGIYVLYLTSSEYNASYKIFSDGQSSIVCDKSASLFSQGNIQVKDTLVLTKSGYLSREVPVTGIPSYLSIDLLSESNRNVDYFNELINEQAFDIVSGLPSRSNNGEVKSVKIIYDFDKDIIYYIHSVKYDLHYTFSKEVLGYKGGLYAFNQTQYPHNPKRTMYLGSVDYYQSQDRYVLQLVGMTEMDCNDIQSLYSKIVETSFIADKLYFFPIKPEWESCNGVKLVTSEELYEGQNYQALNRKNGYGYLQKVRLQDINTTYLGRHDIVLVNGIPNDVSVVSGIITTEFQTPLSHINVLSNSRGTPNMALRDGWTNPVINELIGALVYLNVTSESFEIRKASIEEATAFWDLHTPQTPIILSKNTQTSGLIKLEDANYTYLNTIGGKAANFAELMNVSYFGRTIPLPENAFAIPFYYYDKHLKDNGIDQVINSMFSNPDFNTDPSLRKSMLEELKKQIIDAPIDADLLALVNDRIGNFELYDSFKFRSSTNAEDLEAFSGAGLYDSFSAKKNHQTKTVELAIKSVWASLWNWRAFEERSYFKIDHLSCAMGILVQRSFPSEFANGVLVTKNLYNFNPGFIINVQFGENSIVYPEPGVIYDQIMLYEYAGNILKPFLIEYLTISNLPESKNGRVMTDDEIYLLGNYSMAIKKHFYYNVPHSCGCEWKDFGVDIEFKVDNVNGQRKVYVKQARLYK